MAEYVFQNVEGMLPELEEMERLELFTKDEIKYVRYQSLWCTMSVTQ